MSNNDLSDIPQLKANSKSAQLTYSSGKYGFTINNTFYEIGGGGMPTLNYTTPLHTFSANNLSYTATKDCYVTGTLFAQSNSVPCILTINNTNVFYGGRVITGAGTNVEDSNIPIIKLKSGDIVSVNTASVYLHVYEEA